MMLSAALPAMAQDCKPLTVLIATDMRPERGQPVIPVTINGANKKLVVNTASVFSAISQPAVKEFNLNALQSNIRLIDNAGRRADHYVIIPTLTIGGAKGDSLRFMVEPAPGPMNPNDADLVGVLGPDILQNYDLDLDFGGRKMQLISPDHCEGKVVYWQAPTVAVVPMRLAEGSKIVISVELDGKKLDAVLSTGSGPTVLNLDVAQDRFKVKVDAPDVQEIGQVGRIASAKIYRRRFQSIAFDGVKIENPEINLVPDQLKGALVNKNQQTGSLVRGDSVATRLPDMTIGMQTLGRLHVYIAYRDRKVYITEASGGPQGGGGVTVAPPAQ
jgi:hypothetical protein